MSFCGWNSGEKYRDHFKTGKYVCANCGHDLFASTQKFQHSSPWPAFTQTIAEDSVQKRPDGPSALKVSCGKCGNGLGHEFFGDGPGGSSRF